MDNTDFRDTLAQHIINILQENLPSGIFKQYYEGDPLAIPEGNYPAVCVVKTVTRYKTQAMGLDERRHFFNIELVFDKRSEFGKNSNEVILQKTMEQLAEGIDPTTNTYSAMSVVGILRTLFTLQGWTVDNNIAVQYNVNPNRGNVLSLDAIIQCDFMETIQVPNRT